MTNIHTLSNKIDSLNQKVDKILSREKKEWLRTKEAAEYLGISETQLYSFRKEGIIPYSKLGGSLYFKTSDIDHILENNIQGGH